MDSNIILKTLIIDSSHLLAGPLVFLPGVLALVFDSWQNATFLVVVSTYLDLYDNVNETF